MLEIAVITDKMIETNEYVHCSAMKAIEFYPVRVIISCNAVEFDVKYRIIKK